MIVNTWMVVIHKVDKMVKLRFQTPCLTTNETQELLTEST